MYVYCKYIYLYVCLYKFMYLIHLHNNAGTNIYIYIQNVGCLLMRRGFRSLKYFNYMIGLATRLNI